MTPREFIYKWSKSTLKERSASQEHFIDLCGLLDQQTPATADPHGNWYTFDRGAKKPDGSDGWADVWKRGCFGWEYKGKHKDLTTAYAQLQRYAVALENPPLLVVSDMETLIIHTNFTNTVHEQHTLTLEDLEREENRRLLRWVFTDPDRLKPGKTREKLTEEVAGEFTRLAVRLRDEKGHDPHLVAHFVNKILFCLFAQDINLLPEALFTRLLQAGIRRPDSFQQMATELFEAMRKGSTFGADAINWFNGGLFNDAVALPLDAEEIQLLLAVVKKDWSAIEPSIFGTLFERGLDPDKRSQLGAHYTDRSSIERIVGPVVLHPLTEEWIAKREEIRSLQKRGIEKDQIAASHLTPIKDRPSAKRAATEAYKEAQQQLTAFLDRLALVRVLDPACGSGNFLYVVLQGLHDLEHRALLDAEALGLHTRFPQISPESVLGIEINPYAAELSRVTIWIGEIQWLLNHGYELSKNPILRNLDQIACRDALLNFDGAEASWPDADFIIGNPPFLGDKKMISELGREYVMALRKAFGGRVPGGADFVTYWFEKSKLQIQEGKAIRVGLVATSSIRGGQNRKVLERIQAAGDIFNAWSDEPWVLEGASVRVSLVCFEGANHKRPFTQLNGSTVNKIYADLTAGLVDLTSAKPLSENTKAAFSGISKKGSFEIRGEQARCWLTEPRNPNGLPNSDVVRPWINGIDVTRRLSDMWIIDFGELNQKEASLFESPFSWVETHVLPERKSSNSQAERRQWWLLARRAPAMQQAIAPLRRFIVTPEVSKHRVFCWMPKGIIPDKNVVVIAREDDCTFGVLQSHFHEIWALLLGTALEDRPRYTSSTTFRTYPFPDGLTPNIPFKEYEFDPRSIAIADAACKLDELRNKWLNPPELIKRVPEVVPGFPDRLLPVSEEAAKELGKRTLTSLYNTRPTWLANAHAELDHAVAAAYGWPEDICEADALSRLLELNLARARVKP